MPTALTREQQADLYLRQLRADFRYYAPRVLKIRTKPSDENPEGGIKPFALNKAQEHVHERIELQRQTKGKVRVIILKGRQQGISTYVEGRFYWKASGERGKSVKILTHLAEATTNLFNMTRRYHELAPPDLKPATRLNSTTALEFNRLGSEFSVSTAGSPGTGRSSMAQYFHGSEVAFWENATDLMAGIGQVVPNAPGTEIILESTANGVGNWFHQAVMDCMDGKGEYELIFVPWFWQSEYRSKAPVDFTFDAEAMEYKSLYSIDLDQLYWRHLKITDDFKGETSIFDQEYPATIPLAFTRVMGDTFIPIKIVARAQRSLMAPAVGLKVLGIDPAEFGNDSTVFIGRQGRDARQFYLRKSKVGPMNIAGIAMRAIREHGFQVTNIDCTGGYGGGVADILESNGYTVNRINFGATAIDDDRYPKRVDEMWGLMKAWLEDGPVAIPNDPVLQIELTMRLYGYDTKTRTVIESKKAMKKRGLRSPDGGDALALTFALPTIPVAPPPAIAPFQGGTMGY